MTTIQRTPIIIPRPNKRIVNCSHQIILCTKRLLRKHLKQSAILYTRDRKSISAKLVQIHELYPRFVVFRYKCYDPKGNFRCYLHTCINYVDFLIGRCKIQYLDE